MKSEILESVGLSPLFLSQIIVANVALPSLAWGISFLLFVAIVIIETFIFCMLTNRVFRVEFKFQKLVLGILVANIITSFLGVLIFSDDYRGDALMWSLAYFLTVFIEWMIYIPVFHKETVNKIDLLKTSFIVNIGTYFILTLFLY